MNSGNGIWIGMSSAVALLCGCGGLKGKPSTTVLSATGGTNAVQAPSMIYVSDFYLPPEMIQRAKTLREQAGLGTGPLSGLREDLRSLREPDPETKAKELVKTLGEAIASELKNAGYRAKYQPSATGLRPEFFPEDAKLPKTGWLLGGWFQQVQEANRAEEAAIGFGVGAGKVSIEVVVSDLAHNPRQPFLYIGSENGQQRMPGGVVAKNPYAIAAKFVLERGETDRDVKAMGSSIANFLVQYIQGGPTNKTESAVAKEGKN